MYSTTAVSKASSSSDITSVMNQLESSASTSVTLGSSSNSTATPIYTAQGLLQQINATQLNNDKILFGDASSSDSFSSNTGLPSQLAGFASQLGNPSQTNNSKSTLDLTTDWTTALKTNPSMVPVLVQNQVNQTLISIFDTTG